MKYVVSSYKDKLNISDEFSIYESEEDAKACAFVCENRYKNGTYVWLQVDSDYLLICKYEFNKKEKKAIDLYPAFQMWAHDPKEEDK